MLLTLVDPWSERVEFNSVVDSVSTVPPENCFFHAFLTCNTLIGHMLLALKSVLKRFFQLVYRTHKYTCTINLCDFTSLAKISIATPCEQLRTLNRYWNTIVLLLTDKTPNIHVNPSSGVRINPPLNATLQEVYGNQCEINQNRLIQNPLLYLASYLNSKTTQQLR